MGIRRVVITNGRLTLLPQPVGDLKQDSRTIAYSDFLKENYEFEVWVDFELKGDGGLKLIDNAFIKLIPKDGPKE